MRAVRRLALATLSIALLLPAAAQAAAAPPEFYGVVSQAGLADEDFARMNENGVGVMRVQLSWKKVQPDEGECEGSLPVSAGVSSRAPATGATTTA